MVYENRYAVPNGEQLKVMILDKLRAIPCKNQPNPYGGSARMVMDFLHTLRIY